MLDDNSFSESLSNSRLFPSDVEAPTLSAVSDESELDELEDELEELDLDLLGFTSLSGRTSGMLRLSNQSSEQQCTALL